ncbi:hypothetical protein AB4254_12020 [Vibrio breoganii]
MNKQQKHITLAELKERASSKGYDHKYLGYLGRTFGIEQMGQPDANVKVTLLDLKQWLDAHCNRPVYEGQYEDAADYYNMSIPEVKQCENFTYYLTIEVAKELKQELKKEADVSASLSM